MKDKLYSNPIYTIDDSYSNYQNNRDELWQANPTIQCQIPKTFKNHTRRIKSNQSWTPKSIQYYFWKRYYNIRTKAGCKKFKYKIMKYKQILKKINFFKEKLKNKKSNGPRSGPRKLGNISSVIRYYWKGLLQNEIELILV